MNGKFLLDTNIVIALFASDATVQANVVQAPEVFLAAPVFGELCYGAAKSGRPVENLARVEAFAATLPVIVCDLGTGRQYGALKAKLASKGKLIPDNDIWIAALAIQHGITLVSRDAHFAQVDSLVVENW